MPIDTLEDVFTYGLQEAHYVENRLFEVLDGFESDATNDQLARGFADHREETSGHVERVERVFDAIGRVPVERGSRVLVALVEECERSASRPRTTSFATCTTCGPA